MISKLVRWYKGACQREEMKIQAYSAQNAVPSTKTGPNNHKRSLNLFVTCSPYLREDLRKEKLACGIARREDLTVSNSGDSLHKALRRNT